MIRVFGVDKPNNETFTSNGDIVIQPTKAIIRKYENSDFCLELEASIEYINYLVEGRIIVADVPWLSSPLKTELFRIGNVNITHNKIVTKCLHLTYDLNWFVPSDGYTPIYGIVNFNGFLYQAYNQYGAGRFTKFTIPLVQCEIPFDPYKIKTHQQSMLDTINAVLSTNNMFFNRERDTFYCTKERVETETNITLEYSKNIRTFQKSENWDDTVHAITTYIPTSWQRKVYECPDEYAYYPAGYDKTNFIKYTKYMEFKSRLNPKDYETSSDYNLASTYDMLEQIDDYFKEHGKPKINYTLNAYVDNVIDLGYKVRVIDRQMGVEIMAAVVGFQYNLLTETYDEVVFGNYKESMKSYNYRINANIKNLQDQVGSIAYPINAIFTTSDSYQDPNTLSGFEGYWTLLSSSGGVYTWKRVS